jgi:hypothetical protein
MSRFRAELPRAVWPSLRFNGHGLVRNGLQRLGRGFDGDRDDNAAEDQSQEAKEDREHARTAFGWAKVAVSNCGRSNECPIEGLDSRPALSSSYEQSNGEYYKSQENQNRGCQPDAIAELLKEHHGESGKEQAIITSL